MKDTIVGDLHRMRALRTRLRLAPMRNSRRRAAWSIRACGSSPTIPSRSSSCTGYVGYQIHFQFAEGETFVNLAAGDNKALDVGYEANHLVLKPLAEKVATNITVITNRRVYQFDYSALG